jgi:ankyrin repeat protein
MGIAATIKSLLAYGANPNVADGNGRTALMVVCYPDMDGAFSVQAVRMLLSAGAKCDAQDTNGQTALMEACGVALDCRASDGCAIPLITLLPQHGADPDIWDKSSRTALGKLLARKWRGRSTTEAIRLLRAASARR